ncbi:putative deaminase [Trypanosoma grayi]|uniref:putative deaminase n=1 Tax=Trypanosoma grayi TaxID=71804 RepID=UPI0004F402FE|nr:putative deaminase [Trypanosoma grayi]KEG12969.1 putative deaminase [Trypanosoma grayi]
MEEVIAPEDPPQLVRGVVVRIGQPSWSAAFLRIANKTFPLEPHASHLKRIRKRSTAGQLPPIFEASSVQSRNITVGGNDQEEVDPSTVSGDCSLELLLAVGESIDAKLLREFETVTGGSGSVVADTVWVPDRAPRTSPVEWRKWCDIWPFSVPKPRPASPLPNDERTQIRRIFSEVVLPLAKRVRSDETLGMAATLVDSSQDWRVVASSEKAVVLRRSNPVACFGYIPVDGCKCDESIVLDHPVTYVLKELARIQSGDASNAEVVSYLANNMDLIVSHEPASNAEVVSYLANNMDLIVSHEPCVMCSMALVHSRIRRVFYCFPNRTHGGLGSVFPVHSIPSLNHHFRVFRCSPSWLCKGGPELNCSCDEKCNCWEVLCSP